MREYGDFGEDGLNDALADLNDAFGELDGFGKIESGAMMALPVVLGAGFTFGTAALLDYFITDPATAETWLPYKWLIGAVVGTVVGVVLWKTEFGGASAGIVTIAAALTLALVQYVQGYIVASRIAAVAEAARIAAGTPPAAGYRAYMVGNANPIYGSPYGGFGRYETGNPADLYQSPTYAGLAEGTMVNLKGLGEGEMVNLRGMGDQFWPQGRALSGAINPGVFG